jgi:hypothetical protein
MLQAHENPDSAFSGTALRSSWLMIAARKHIFPVPTRLPGEARLRPLMEKFGQLLLDQPLFADIYGLI